MEEPRLCGDKSLSTRLELVNARARAWTRLLGPVPNRAYRYTELPTRSVSGIEALHYQGEIEANHLNNVCMYSRWTRSETYLSEG